MSVTGNVWQSWPLLVAKTNHSTPPEATWIFMLLFVSILVESKCQHISLIVSAIMKKRSRLPGVIITQYVTSIPEGKSTPDFKCKLAPVTVEEGGRLNLSMDGIYACLSWMRFMHACHFECTPLSGETAIFRVRVKGDPKPDVSWKKTKGAISENETFQTTYDESTGEHILKVGYFTVLVSPVILCIF